MPFKAGDIVRLKSGGPKMTVAEPDAGEVTLEDILAKSWEPPTPMDATTKSPERYRCQWFIGSRLSSAVFLEQQLEPCTDETSTKP